MKTLRSYPGLLTMLLVAAALAVNGVVDYIDYEVAGPSFLAAITLAVLSLALVVVYEIKALKARIHKIRSAKQTT